MESNTYSNMYTTYIYIYEWHIQQYSKYMNYNILCTVSGRRKGSSSKSMNGEKKKHTKREKEGKRMQNNKTSR